MLMSSFTCKHGEGGTPISYWCNSGCWEAGGKSSRFIEQYMKGIKAVGRYDEALPIDSCDFGRCVDILNKHPEWQSRIHELGRLRGFKNWSRLVKHWDTLMMLYNDLPVDKSYKLFTDRDKQKFNYFSHLLQGVTTDHGLLKTHKLRCNSDLFDFKLNNFFVVGSLVLQEKNQDDEFDLYTSFVIDVFPEDVCCERYKEDGKSRGWHSVDKYMPKSFQDTHEQESEDHSETHTKTLNNVETEIAQVLQEEIQTTTPSDPPVCTIHYPRKPVVDTPVFRSQEIIKKLHAKMNEYIKRDPSTWQTTNYHYCPHYVLYANGETPENTPIEAFNMFMADVYPLTATVECWKLGTCVISITDQHKLHPSNKVDDEEFEVTFNDEKWVISQGSIKLYTYYDEGLINSNGDEEPETITEKEIERKIQMNVAENIKLEQREREINNNSKKTPVQNFGFVGLVCG